MHHPQFSILLPTRNRAAILGEAIESVIRQSCSDWELVVADNDDSEVATRQVVEAFQDTRIKLFRSPSRLAMQENWELALANVSGSYMLVLEDKQRLSPHALELLNAALRQTASPLVTYVWGESPQVSEQSLSGLRRVTPEQTIRLFCRFDTRCIDLFPRGMNCCVSLAMITDIRAKNGFVFGTLNPDFVFGFAALLTVKEYWHLPQVLVFTKSDAVLYSNGFGFARKAALSRKFFRDCGISENEILSHVPIKSIWLLQNIVLYDYFTKFRPHCPEPWAQISWWRYFVACIESIRFMQRQGTDVSEEVREVRQAIKGCTIWFKIQVFVGVFAMLAKRGFLRLRKHRQS